MKILTKITGIFIVVLTFVGFYNPVWAQQDPMYTQYMDNLLIINPGFAGSKENGNLLVVSRNQWVGFEGAPKTNSLSYNTRLADENIGLGFSIVNDKIGPQSHTGLHMDYSYFLDISDKFRLGMGAKIGVNFYRSALTELNPLEPDPIYAQDIYKNFLPNFGTGLYLYSKNTYFGFSIPDLIRNKITRDEYLTEYVQREEIHMYFVMGKKFRLGQDIHLKASSMVRYVQIAPVTFDLTALFGFKEKFWAGAMFRLGDAYGLLAQFKASDKMTIGYSYDLTYSELNAYNRGTHEIMFSYDLYLFH